MKSVVEQSLLCRAEQFISSVQLGLLSTVPVIEMTWMRAFALGVAFFRADVAQSERASTDWDKELRDTVTACEATASAA